MRRVAIACLIAGGLFASVAIVGSMATVASSQQSISDAREKRAEARKQQEAAASELDAAKAADEEVYAALIAITSVVHSQQADIDEVQRQLGTLRAEAATAAEAILQADAEGAALGQELATLAVAGYVNGGEQPSVLFASDDIVEALRQGSLLDQANGDTSDLLEQMRNVREDREIAQQTALEAVAKAESLELELAEELLALESQQAVQAELKAEHERRIADWEGKVSDLDADVVALTAFIQAEEAKVAAAEKAAAAAAAAAAPTGGGGGGSTVAQPGSASSSGFQWPIGGSVTSGYGYRVHPIYGTRRLHTGIDVSGGTGTPIAAAKGGTVIDARYSNGYGNMVVVSHGGGISTLYAHQSKLNVSAGDTVGAGDIVGWVGSTGASTGPHLHFEVRVSGSPVDPRPYLP